MKEKQKIDVAAFRFSIINDFVNGIMLDHGEKERLLREKCDRKWVIPHSDKTSISRGTIQRWIKLYEESGNNLESLYPRGRNDRGKQRALDEETCLGLVRLREEMPDVTVPFIIKTMKKRDVVRRKTYLIAFIDDHSRLIPYGQFYTSENVQSFMHAFEQALLRRGMPRKLYVDNGSAYRSQQLMHTAPLALP